MAEFVEHILAYLVSYNQLLFGFILLRILVFIYWGWGGGGDRTRTCAE